MSIEGLEAVLLGVAKCDSAMAALPESVRAEIDSVKGEFERRVKEREETERKLELARRKAEAEAEKERISLEAKYLCKGSWGERVPLIRRFALCESIGKKFIGYCGQERDPAKWVDRVDYCPIDLVRGFMGPYWGYYGQANPLKEAYKRIRSVLEAEGTKQTGVRIDNGFGFFKIRPEEKDRPFVILSYTVEADGNVHVTGRSEPMKWEQHRAVLKAEFAQEGDADPE